jgi:pyrimidine operon attenuation protein/uracil phosphoribosyltransferase
LADKPKELLDEKKIGRMLTRIAHEILEHNAGAETLAVIGILTRGAYLAQRIAATIKKIEGIEVPVGLMDISLYRDDVHSKLDQPVIQRTDILFPVGDKNIVLIDDVLFTGRTIRAALDQIIDFGRPRTIQLAVLIDRGHRELPIKADYVGANIPTAKSDRVVVQVTEKDGCDSVHVIGDNNPVPGPGRKPRPGGRSKGGKR